MTTNQRFRRWLYQRGIRYHAQILDRDGRGSMWRAGRAWIKTWAGDGDTGEGYKERLEINPEWVFRLQARAGASFRIGDRDSANAIQTSLSTPLGSVYLDFDGLPDFLTVDRLPCQIRPYRYAGVDGTYKSCEPREIRVEYHGGAIWWSLWHHPHEWNNRTPRWRNGNFSPVNWLLGRRQYSTVELERRRVRLSFPEGTYDAEIILTEDTRKRPRSPFVRRIKRAEIKVELGVPVPGKGENSWDCGEDAIYSLTTPAISVNEAIGKFVADVYRTRLRYGGSEWKPERAA